MQTEGEKEMTDEIRQLEKELKRKRNEMRNSNPVTKSNKYDFINEEYEES